MKSRALILLGLLALVAAIYIVNNRREPEIFRGGVLDVTGAAPEFSEDSQALLMLLMGEEAKDAMEQAWPKESE